MTMDYYAGIDVSLEASSVCVVDGAGKMAREAKVASEPEALILFFRVWDCHWPALGSKRGLCRNGFMRG
jgi:transposase